MRKKFLSGLLALAITMSASAFFAMAEETADEQGYELWYQNAFDTGATGGPTALTKETDNFDLTVASKGGWNTVSFEGNTGVATNQGAWPSGRNFVFDFTKGGTKPALTTGIYRISFEISARPTGGGDTLWTGMNMTDHYTGGRLMRTYMAKENGKEVKYLNALATVGQWNGGQTMTLDPDMKYKLDMFLDLEGKTMTTYIDNNFFANTVITASMNNFVINLNGYWDYFDNLIVEKWDRVPEFKAEIGEASEMGINVKTTFPAKNWSEFAENVKIKRLFDGKELTASVETLSLTEAVIRPSEGFVNGYNYEVILPDTLDGLCGTVCDIINTNIDVEFATENAVKSIKLKDYSGEEVLITDENVPEIQSVIIEFTEDVAAETKMGSVKISDADGNPVPFTAKCNANIGEAVFDGVLKENTSYTVEVFDFGVEYKIDINTTNGTACIKAVKLYNADGEEITLLSDVGKGDKVTAVLEISNTTGTSVSYLGTLKMNNGKLMTGVKFLSDEVTAFTKNSSEFEFEIKDTTDLAFTGLMWHAEKTAPLAESMTFDIK